MKIDLLQPPRLVWFEDANGNECNFEEHPPKIYSKTLLIRTHCETGGVENFISRFLKWVFNLLPESWTGPKFKEVRVQPFGNSSWPIIKYLVENRKFDIKDAIILSARLCHHCHEVCCSEIVGVAPNPLMAYIFGPRHCKYCKIIDEDHHNKFLVERCYHALKFGHNIKETYDWKYDAK